MQTLRLIVASRLFPAELSDGRGPEEGRKIASNPSTAHRAGTIRGSSRSHCGKMNILQHGGMLLDAKRLGGVYARRAARRNEIRKRGDAEQDRGGTDPRHRIARRDPVKQ